MFYVLSVTLAVITFLAFVVYNWKRRWLYYCSAVMPGPVSLPLIGSVMIVFTKYQDIYSTFDKLMAKYPRVWRYWLGPELFISSSRLSDVEYFLNNHLSKEHVIPYTYSQKYCSNILTAKTAEWKLNRKIVNPSFNQRIINSFHPILLKYSNKLTRVLEKSCEENAPEILPMIWRCTLDGIFETIGGVNSKILSRKNTKFIPQIVRYEELLIKRLVNPQYYFTFIWHMTPFHKELVFLVEDMKIQIRELIDHHRNLKMNSSGAKGNFYENKTFVNCLIEGGLTQQEIENEITFMFVAGSETTAITVCLVLLILSIYPDIQENVHKEIQTIFGDSGREITLQDINQFDYLDRVIKETMRVLPPAPIIARYVDETVNLGSQFFPKGSIISFPIWRMHRDPKYWVDPLKFDPDRFLPEQINNIPRGAYIPFSTGPRNCIGRTYGMLVMKTILASMLRCFQVKPGRYKSIEEIQLVFHIIAKPIDGFPIQLQKRYQ